MRTETKYNKVVNFDKEENEITVLDYTFNHNDGFKGATGIKFEPISREEYNERIEPYLSEPMELLKYYVEQGFGLTSSMIDNINEVCEETELRGFLFDTSYSEMWDEIREEVGLTEEEAYIFNCSGGGRCFKNDFQGNINTELSAVIREFETK